MDEDVRRLLQEELDRRELLHQRLTEGLYPYQRDFIADPCKKKAVLGTRRAGKSKTIANALLLEATTYPEAKCVYFTHTDTKAKEDFWEPHLLRLNSELQLGGTPTGRTLKFPNGSSIICRGIGSSRAEAEKIRGGGYRMLVIDEAASQTHIDMDYTVNFVIAPALQDFDGTVILMGTPGPTTHGFFYEVTRPEGALRTKGWSFHKFNAWDNEFQRPKWQADVDEKLLYSPAISSLPSFRREYYGEWSVDETLSCFPSLSKDDPRLWSQRLPPLRPGDRWHVVIGCDLGNNSSLVLICFSKGQDKFFIYDCWKTEPKSMKPEERDITAVSLKAKQMNDSFRNAAASRSEQCLGTRWIVDGAAAQTALEMRTRHGIPWEISDKNTMLKASLVELLDADFRLSKCQVVPSAANKALIDELTQLTWDEDLLKHDGKREFDGRLPDHLTDALLYAWRMSFHRRGKLSNLPNGGQLETEADRMFRLSQQRQSDRLRQQQQRMGRPPTVEQQFPGLLGRRGRGPG